ncbi:MAG: tetratricopeptide repeat protein [Devosia sp.]
MSSDTIFSEVDEELRRDRVRQLWRMVAPWVIGGAVAVVVGVAGYEGWTWWQKTNSAKWSNQFYAAMETADGTDAAASQAALDKLIVETGGGYPTLAQFRKAALLAHDGKIDEAVAAYDALANQQTDTHLRELALVLAAHLLVDKGDVAAVQQRVGGMLLPNSALRGAAREVIGLTQYKAGDRQAALTSFQSIIDDPTVSRELSARIQIFIAQLIAEGAVVPTVPPAEAPATDTPEAGVDEDTELDVVPPATSSAPPSAASSEAAGVSSEAPVN